MRVTFLIWSLVFLQVPPVVAQIQLEANQWQQDIRFLQHTVHQDYPFLFRKISRESFDRQAQILYESVPELDDHQVIVGIARLVSLFGYGHTNLWLTGWEGDNRYGFHQMPYNLYYFSDGIYIQGVHQDYQNTIGARVLEVEGMPVLEALEKIRPVVPVENEQFFKSAAVYYLGTPEVLHAQGVKSKFDTQVTLSLQKDGQVFEQTFQPVTLESGPLQYGLIPPNEPWVVARNTETTPAWLKNLHRIYYKEYYPDHKALYVRHSQIQDDDSIDIPGFYKEVFEFIDKNEVEKLIIDFRLNGGGNNYKNKPVVTGIIGSRINVPGKFFVIIGRRTFSACQNMVNELDSYTNVIFVGEPTGENINFYGDNRRVVLPNSNIPVRLSFAWWQDKPPWENARWLAPDLPVEMSFEDYASNRDPVLEAVWNYQSLPELRDPIEYLTELYQTGQQDKIASEATRLVRDPNYRYYPFEERIDQLGHNLLGNGQFEPAVWVFQMNTGLFPGSAKAWSSLAEAFWKSGDAATAINLYEKSLSMDPDGMVGETSKNMLDRIKQQTQVSKSE